MLFIIGFLVVCGVVVFGAGNAVSLSDSISLHGLMAMAILFGILDAARGVAREIRQSRDAIVKAIEDQRGGE